MRCLLYAVTAASALLAATSVALPHSKTHSLNARSLPPTIRPGWTLGKRAEADTPYTFSVALQSRDLYGLASRMEQVSRGEEGWLSDDELAQYTAPSDDALSAVQAELTAAGIPASHITPSKHGDFLTVDATVDQVERLFDTKLFHHSFERRSAIRAPSGFALPQHLAEHIVDVAPLTHFGVPHASQSGGHAEPLDADNVEATIAQQKREVAEMAAHLERRQSSPASCSRYATFVSPACLRDLYQTSSVKPVAAAGTVDIGVMGIINASFSQEDLTEFAQRYRSDAAGYEMPVNITRGAPFDTKHPDKEGTLDAQVVLGQTYPLNSTFYAWGSTKTGGDAFSQSWQDFIDMKAADRPGVISYSFASQENWYSASTVKSMCQTAQKLTALGTTIVVAAGDYGVLGVNSKQSCDKKFINTYPSVCPYVLSVGATGGSGSKNEIAPEVMMSKSVANMWSGAGFSEYIPRPQYQDAAVSAYLKTIGDDDKGRYNIEGRAYPDVAAQGTKYVIRQNGGWYTISGTSAAAPTWASIIALLNAERRQQGKGTIGWAHPTLYRAANSAAFNDVVSGGSYGCSDKKAPGFKATKGWDAAAGLGTPNYPALANLFAGAA